MASEQQPIEPGGDPVAGGLGDSGAADPAPQASEQRAATPDAGDTRRVSAKPPRTRTSTAFSGFVAGAVVVILLLVFILENTGSVRVSYFGASGDLPLGVALLFAAVGGALLVGILGTARIAQVRLHARRRARGR